MDGVFFKWWYVTPSSPGDELDDLFARTFFILPGSIGDRLKGVISSGSGDGITSSIHAGRPGLSEVLYRELAPLVTFAK